MTTSHILLQDIKTILRKLAGDEGATDANPWLYRAQKLLMSLFPIVISLEQSGKTVNPASLMSLDSVEQWMLDLEGDSEFKNSGGLLLELKQFLAILPGYKEELIGQQEPWTHEKYGYHIMMARTLCDATKAFQPSSLGTCNTA